MIPPKARKPGVSTNVYIFITGTNTLYKMIQIWFVSKRVLHVYTQLGLDELMSGTAYQKLVLSSSLSITSASLYLSIFPPTGSFITFFLVCLKFRVDPMFFIFNGGPSPSKFSLALGKNIWNHSRIIIQIARK